MIKLVCVVTDLLIPNLMHYPYLQKKKKKKNSFPYEKEKSENSYLNRKTQNTSEQYVPTGFE